MTIQLLNIDNAKYIPERTFHLIFADFVYENLDFEWANYYWHWLREGGIFISMSDFHSDYLLRTYMENVLEATFVSHLVWKNEWGNHPKDRYHQCFDSILVYSNITSGWKFYSDKIQVPKVTKSKGLNPSGRETKTATAWIDDITLTTVSKERVKKQDGHLIKWQKPIRLYDRIISPFTKEGDWILDIFAGSGSLGKWCKQNNKNYVGLELDKEAFELAEENIAS